MRELTNEELIQQDRIQTLIKRRDGYANLIARMAVKRERIPVGIRKEYRRLDNVVMVEMMVMTMLSSKIEQEAYCG